MDTWIDQAQFQRVEVDEPEPVTIEGGFESFERVDIREQDEDELHIFKIEKVTDLFEITLHWAVDPENNDEAEMGEDELKDMAKSRVKAESEYQAAHYLKSMDLPPIQGLFTEGMVVEVIPEEESDES